MHKEIKNWKNKLDQIEVSKACGGRTEDVPAEAWIDGNNWVAEDKLDGTRLKFHITEEGIRVTTRRVSKKTGEYMERSDNFLHFRDLIIPELVGTVLDGEGFAPTHTWSDTASIIGSSPETSWEKQESIGNLEYWVFDLITHNGEDLTNRPYSYRLLILEQVMEIIKRYDTGNCFRRVEQQRSDKKEYYKKIVSAGGEGVMMKNLDSKYYDKKGLVKVKKFERFTMIITSFKAGTGKYTGLVGSVGVGFHGETYDRGQLTFASGITDALRTYMAKDPDSYLGRVVEIECAEVTSTGSLRHPRFIGFREDKSQEDCVRDQNKVVNK